MDELLALITTHRVIERQIHAAKEALFPLGSVVRGKGNRHLWGVVVHGADQPVDKIAILFENGNIWFRELKEWTVIEDRALWPDEIRAIRRRRSQIGTV